MAILNCPQQMSIPLGKVLYWLSTGEVYDGHEEAIGEPLRVPP